MVSLGICTYTNPQTCNLERFLLSRFVFSTCTVHASKFKKHLPMGFAGVRRSRTRTDFKDKLKQAKPSRISELFRNQSAHLLQKMPLKLFDVRQFILVYPGIPPRRSLTISSTYVLQKRTFIRSCTKARSGVWVGTLPYSIIIIAYLSTGLRRTDWTRKL